MATLNQDIIFVSNTAGGSAGTFASPYATVQDALDNVATGGTIYVIGTGTTYRETLEMTVADIDNVTITTSKTNPAIFGANSTASLWSLDSGSEYILDQALPAGSFLDVDTWTVYEGGVKALTGTKGSLAAGEYNWDGSNVIYRSTGSVDPTAVAFVPFQNTAAEGSRFLDVTVSCEDWIIENIKVTERGLYGFVLDSMCVRWTLRNITFENCMGNMIYVTSDDNRIVDCIMTENGVKVTSQLGVAITGLTPAAILIEDASDNLISRNLIHDFSHSGIKVSHPAGTTTGDNVIVENTVHAQEGGLGGAAYHAHDKQSTTVWDYWRGNLAFYCLDNAFLVEGSKYNTFFNNTLAFNYRGAHFTKLIAAEASEYNEFINNIVHRSGYLFADTSFWLTNDAANEGLRAAAVSVEYSTSDTAADITSMKNNVFRNNLYFTSGGDTFFRLGGHIHEFDEWKTLAATTLAGISESDSTEADATFLDGSTNVDGEAWASVVRDDFQVAWDSAAADGGSPFIGFGDNTTDAWTIATGVMTWGSNPSQGAMQAPQQAIYPPEDFKVMYTMETAGGSGTQSTLNEAGPLTSFGGEFGEREVTSPGLFPEIDLDEIANTQSRYKALDILNTSIKPLVVDGNSVGTQTDNIDANEGVLMVVGSETGVQIYTVTQSTKGYTVEPLWEENSPASYNAATASDITTPTVGSTFPTTSSTAPDYRTTTTTIVGTTVAALGVRARFWLKRVVAATAKFVEGEKITFRIKGEQDSNG